MGACFRGRMSHCVGAWDPGSCAAGAYVCSRAGVRAWVHACVSVWVRACKWVPLRAGLVSTVIMERKHANSAL